MKPSDVALNRESITQLQSDFERFWQHFFLAHQERYSYSDFFEPLYQDMVEFVSRRAKRIRPILFLVSHSIFSKKNDSSNALFQVAAALELLHSFILIHDDIIDRSEVRRGLPTFHKLMEKRQGPRLSKARLGQNIALVMGDILLVLAIETFFNAALESKTKEKAFKRFLAYITDTGCGEMQDILLSTRDLGWIEPEEIQEMYHYKTTRYTIESPLVLGALLGGASEESLMVLEHFSNPIGMAFQIQNDLIEFKRLSCENEMFQSDLLEGKKTFLLREAYEKLNETDRSFLQLYLNYLQPEEGSIHKIRELVEKSKAVESLEEKVEYFFQQAIHFLNQSHLKLEEKEGLIFIINLIRQQTAN